MEFCLIGQNTLLKWYEGSTKTGMLQPDAAQQKLVGRLQHLGDELNASDPEQQSNLVSFLSGAAVGELQSLLGRFLGAEKGEQRIKGIFVHGSVGRGKSFLIDGFFLNLARVDKLRVHFHGFMRRFHSDMKKHEGEKDALKAVAESLADKFSLICFDEFHVSDISDAMILGRILEILFERGVVLVASSNYKPDALYPNGLARDRFLPAIEMIKRNMDVFSLDGDVDYRLRTLQKAALYYSPQDDENRKSFEEMFFELARNIRIKNSVRLGSRRMPAVQRTSDALWVSFIDCCGGNYAANDYLQLAERFATIFISDVPKLGADDKIEETRRFTWLIDVLYDSKVKLVMLADYPLTELFQGEGGESGRTISRLEEMQSHHYLNQASRIPAQSAPGS